MKKSNVSILIVIIFAAAILRFYNLSINPPSLTWDEVAWGYNAYSLGIDGRDEFGRFLPFTYLESFGDYKPPLYAYIDVLPVKIFGLNEFATRFPSAFLGTLTVLLTYFLTKSLFIKAAKKETYALVASGMLAISPWHILLSRAAFEANVGTFLLVLGVWLFLDSLQKRGYLLILSAISFVLGIYTFNTERIVGPLLVIGLAGIYLKQLRDMKKWVILAAIIGLAFVLPTVPFLLSPQAKLRFQEVNIFSDPKIVLTSNAEIANDHMATWSKIVHNRRLMYGANFLQHYFDNVSTDFLFIKGDGNPKFSTQQVGQMYIWEIPFLLFGAYYLFRKRESNWIVIPFWLLVGIIPAATAEQTPHALRIETTLPTFQILSSYGLVNTIALLKPRFSAIPLKKTFIGIIAVVSVLNFFYFLEYYFVHYATDYSSQWQYGYKQAISYITKVQSSYKFIYLTDSLGRPYVYMLFYTKYDPRLYRQNVDVHRDVFGFVTIERFDKYYFNKEIIPAGKVLYVDDPAMVPPKARILRKFYLLDGTTTALTAYTL